MSFKAFVVRKAGPAVLDHLELSDLPHGDLLVRVQYSSLNYKDGLALTGRGPVVRSFPMVPGIDLAGTVVESSSPDLVEGDEIVVTGWGLGETTFGAYSEFARVRSEHALRLPAGLSARDAMAFGTAGFTAMQCLLALESHGLEKGSEVLVTGAGGGVGGIAILALAHAGYRPIASSGRPELEGYLRSLGATSVIGRDEIAEGYGPLGKTKWAAAIDSVGGVILAGLLRHIEPDGSVAVCGVAAGPELVTTVLPFILRGVNILGINSVSVPNDRRSVIWERLSELPRTALESVVEERPLEDLLLLGEEILAGRVRGRTVIRVS